MRWAEHVAHIGKMRNGYKVLTGEPERRPRHKWVDTTKINIKETGFEDMDFVHLAQRWVVVNTVMNLWIPQKAAEWLLASQWLLQHGYVHGLQLTIVAL
jgi:hypothetical protein